MSYICALMRGLATGRFCWVVALSLACSGSAIGAPAQSDDFDRFNLDRGLWTFVNPNSVGWLHMVGADSGDAVVELSVPAGPSHDAWKINRSVRLMQPVDDADFELEIRFQSEPTVQYQSQGIIVEQDADNWIRFNVTYDGSRLRAFVGTTTNGSTSKVFNRKIDAGDGLGLRVTRVGNDWTLRYLDTGAGWTTAGPAFTHVMAVNAVGPFVSNHQTSGPSPAYTAVIDSFVNTAAPPMNEDDGAPPDVEPPFIHTIASSVASSNEMEIRWHTDEAATCELLVGLTTDYEIGAFPADAGPNAHTALLSGLTPGQTYHYRIRAVDGLGAESLTDDLEFSFSAPGAPSIEVWYGSQQSFGALGHPQPWVNIVGNVSDAEGNLAGLSYRLNGSGVDVPLTIGPDDRRLHNAGDFNVDLASTDLNPGLNTVLITAVDTLANSSSRTVVVNFTPGTVWPLPYTIDWSALNGDLDIPSVSWVIDGRWGLTQSGGRTWARTLQPGYDRLLGVGDITWTDYEFEVPVVMHTMPGLFGTGVLLRWTGHTDDPIAGRQPKTGWYPLGALLWIRGGSIEIFANNGEILGSQTRETIPGVTYILKGRVQSIPGAGAQYSLKVWEEGLPEPAGWDLTGLESLADPQSGSLLLLAHRADSSFGPLTVTALESAPDEFPPTISNVSVVPMESTALVTWTTDEAADSVVEFGLADTYGSVRSGAAFTVNHSVQLDGLEPDTHYHFRVISTDSSGNSSASGDMEFMTQAAGSPATIQSDEFDDATLDASIWTFVNAPAGDGSMAMTGSQASLSVPAGSAHEVWRKGIEVPRIVQSVENGDFLVEFKVDSLVLERFQEQGLVVEQDPSHYLRFEFYSDGEFVNVIAAALHTGSPTVAFNQPVNVQAPYYMRVHRTGATWTQSYSGDGVNWTQAGVFQNQPLIVSSLGLYAGNAQRSDSPAHTALFDYFRSIPAEMRDACAGDLNSDLRVDGADLAILLSAWRSIEQLADLDDSGLVDGADLANLLSTWGDCP